MSQFASTPGGAGGAPQGQTDWSPSHPEERSYYDGLFSLADDGNTGSIAGKAAVNFFSRSGLDFSILKQVWDVADWKKQHFLRREDFYVSMRLIAMAQAGHQLSRDNLRQMGSQMLPMAKFQNTPAPPNIQSGQQPGGMGGGGAGVGAGAGAGAGRVDQYAMSDQDKTKYGQHFGNYDSNKDGFVEGSEAVALFSKSGLPRESLSKVWELSDMDKDNKLSLHEFCVAMHLIVCVSKKGLPMPTTVPDCLREQPQGATRRSSIGNAFANIDVVSPRTSAVLSPRDEVPLGGSALDMAPPAQAPAPAPSRPSIVPQLDLKKVSSGMGVTSTAPAEKPSMTKQTSNSSPAMPPATSETVKELGSVSESMMGTAQKVMAVNEAALASQDSAISSLKSLVQRLNAEKISLNSSLQSSKQEFQKGSEQLNQLAMEMSRLQEELKLLKTQKEEQEEAIVLQKEQILQFDSNKKNLLADIQRMTQDVADLNNEKDKLAMEVHNMEMEKNKIEAGTQSLGMVFEEHTQDINRIQSELQMIKQIYSTQQQAQVNAQAAVQTLQAQRQNAQNSLASAQQAFDTQRRNVDQAKQERAALSQQFTDLAQQPPPTVQQSVPQYTTNPDPLGPARSQPLSARSYQSQPLSARSGYSDTGSGVVSPRDPMGAGVTSPRDPMGASVTSPRDPMAPPVPPKPKPGNLGQSKPTVPPKPPAKPLPAAPAQQQGDGFGAFPDSSSSSDAFAAFPEPATKKDDGSGTFPDSSNDAFGQGSNFGSSSSFGSSQQNNKSDAFSGNDAFGAFPDSNAEDDAFGGDAFGENNKGSASQGDAFDTNPFPKANSNQDDAFGVDAFGDINKGSSEGDTFDTNPFPKPDSNQDNSGFSDAFADSENTNAGGFDTAFPESTNNDAFGDGFPEDGNQAKSTGFDDDAFGSSAFPDDQDSNDPFKSADAFGGQGGQADDAFGSGSFQSQESGNKNDAFANFGDFS